MGRFGDTVTPERARRLDIQAKEAIDQAEKLLNVATAALRLKKSEETIRRYIRAGVLPAERTPGKRGGNWLIKVSVLDNFLTPSCDITRQAHE